VDPAPTDPAGRLFRAQWIATNGPAAVLVWSSYWRRFTEGLAEPGRGRAQPGPAGRDRRPRELEAARRSSNPTGVVASRSPRVDPHEYRLIRLPILMAVDQNGRLRDHRTERGLVAAAASMTPGP
jgi:hypothetical protein